MNPDLKVIVDYSIKDAQEIGKTKFRLNVPVDMKELLFYNVNSVVDYVEAMGHKIHTNKPDDNAWHGWDMPINRQADFPEELHAGRDHSNYQAMTSTPTTLTVDITLNGGV